MKVFPEVSQPVKGNNCGLIPLRETELRKFFATSSYMYALTHEQFTQESAIMCLHKVLFTRG